MTIRDIAALSAQSLKRGGMRSILSILGIVIGIASVILILSITQAGKRFIVNQVASFGSDLVFLENGPPSVLEGGSVPHVNEREVLTEQDYKALKRQSWITFITPVIYQNDNASAMGAVKSVQVVGTTEDEIPMYGATLSEGSFLTSDDVGSHRRSVVLGSEVASKLFGLETPIGRTIKVGEQQYHVIGVMDQMGTRFMQNVDQYVYMPYTTAMDIYGKDRFMAIVAKVTLSRNDAVANIQATIRDQHNIDKPADDDFRVMTQEDTAKVLDMVTGSLSIFLAAVAGISLLVGGIGIMNIMYVSVTERTREIGIRKALGARTNTILRQFLIEAIMLTSLGGLIGSLLGISLTWIAIQVILLYQTGWIFELSYTGMILAVSFSTAVGLIFGYAPAKKAASVNPIEALRYE